MRIKSLPQKVKNMPKKKKAILIGTVGICIVGGSVITLMQEDKDVAVEVIKQTAIKDESKEVSSELQKESEAIIESMEIVEIESDYDL